MEHNKLLQKMEILSRKISKLKDESISVKIATSNIYGKSGNYNAVWHGHGRLHNQSASKTSYSKYRYMKKPTNAVTANLSAASYSTPVPLAPKPMLQAAPKVHVNPHFKAQGDTKNGLVNKPSMLHSKELIPLPNPVNIPKKLVYINPNVFNSNKSFQRVRPPEIDKKIIPQLPDKPPELTDNKPSQDTKRFIHVNRSLLLAEPELPVTKTDNAKTSVHVNPKVFARLKSEVKKEKPILKGVITTPVNRFRKAHENNSINKSLISISRTKLVRAKRFSQPRTPSNQYSVVRKARLLSTSKVVSSPLVKLAKNVCTKYKYIRKSSANSTPANAGPQTRKVVVPFERTKYKLDRRSHRTPKPYKNVQKFSLKYEKPKPRVYESNLQGIKQRRRYSAFNKSPFGNRVWGNVGSLQPKRVLITNRKLLRIGSSPIVKRVFPAVQSSTLVRIGGILYKTSRTQLTRTNSTVKKSTPRSRVLNRTLVSQKPRLRGGHIVSVRGDKFLMDRRGRTLKRVATNKQLPCGMIKRVDIGGATFIQTTPNVLIRTNRHNVRSLLSQAKHRSIAQLANMRKNNTICKFYRRFGKCFRDEKNRCPCVHDKKYVAICKGFLNGKCEKNGCLLSHDLIPEKMATCKYFLQVCCARDNCPFLHIKLKADAPLCIGFLQGYCSDGIACRKWHFNICPQFDKAGSCPKGKYCPFPHVQRKYTDLSVDHMRLDIFRILGMYAERLGNLMDEKPKEGVFRYFNVKKDSSGTEDKSAIEEQSSNLDVDLPKIESESGGDGNCDSGSQSEEPESTGRPKIGYLPSYIPL